MNDKPDETPSLFTYREPTDVMAEFHNIDDVATIRELRAEVLTLRERVAFLKSPEVCAAAHDDVQECGYCQRDYYKAQLAHFWVRLRALTDDMETIPAP